MVKRTGPTNENLRKLVVDLSRSKSKFWKRVAEDLEKPTRSRREVNLYVINDNTEPNETVIVPGKVLSIGDLDHKVTVAAWNFSGSAKQKINKSGKAISIAELAKIHPEGKGVRILG